MKTRKFFTVAALSLVAGVCIGGCGCRPEKVNCRQLFEASFETNVQAYLSTLPEGADTVAERVWIESFLNRLYETDSTYVLKSGTELEEFVQRQYRVRDSLR